jgi:hypothetical protein
VDSGAAKQLAAPVTLMPLFERNRADEKKRKGKLISANLPQNPKCVIPEALLIGNPAFNRPKSWIPDKDIWG